MGDRGNIVIRYEGTTESQPTDIYFYTHWRGSFMKTILARALERGKGRWNDPPYLARIIFSEMIQNEVLEETGYGISPYEPDNEHPLLIVDTEGRVVREQGTGDWPFQQFVDTFIPTKSDESEEGDA